MTNLTERNCQPCAEGTPSLGQAEVEKLLPQVPGWQVVDRKLQKRFDHPDFLQAMAFVNRMAELAEAQAHHPDFAVHYNKVDVTIWTHSIGGLSDNDFILAAKIDKLADKRFLAG